MRRLLAYSRTAILLCLAIAAGSALHAPVLASSQTSSQTTIYLPVVASGGAAVAGMPQSVFGMVMTHAAPERGLDDVAAAGARWLRSNNNLLWRDVEPIEGAGYHWDTSSVKLIEQEMIAASERDLAMIMIVRASPRWATAPYQADCAPIQPSKYGRFAAFVAAAVERYSKPPYNVKLWQIGNEPDADIFASDSGYGCWGVRGDPYYGGRAYGEMLKVIYPAIKAADQSVQVLHGSMLLSHPYDPASGQGAAGRFFEGVLVAGAARSFDILPFNAFDWSFAQVPMSIDWKATYLQGLLRAYNAPPKPLLATEIALLCTQASDGCRQAQGYAVGRDYARALSHNLLGALWYVYDDDSFHNTALIDPSDPSIKRPAYIAYQQASAMLTGAQYLGPLEGQVNGVEGYRFARPGGQSVVVLWSNTAKPAVVTVPRAANVACQAWDGAALPCASVGGTLALTAQRWPTYVLTGIRSARTPRAPRARARTASRRPDAPAP